MDPSSFLPILSGMLGGATSAGLFKGRPEIQEGLIKITPFGKNFCATCL